MNPPTSKKSTGNYLPTFLEKTYLTFDNLMYLQHKIRVEFADHGLAPILCQAIYNNHGDGYDTGGSVHTRSTTMLRDGKPNKY